MFPISDKYINKTCGLHCKEFQKKNPDDPTELGILNSKQSFKKCHNHTHITLKERETIVLAIIKEFLDAGFLKSLDHFMLDKIIVDTHYTKLLKLNELNHDSISAHKTSSSNKIIRKYMPHLYEVKDKNGSCIKELWNKIDLVKVFKKINKPNYTVNSQFSELLRYLKFTPVTIYSPIMTKAILHTLSVEKSLTSIKVFDPCIGWGGRMLSAIA